MRPVLLRMDGFAAFREPTVVDFRDAEYFVLVGPTGAGKSTVIDAMTFALYGSVPRWDDRRTVALALAPTVARGTVALVFDVGGERYVVARELRRTASGSVTVKGARLERLADPAGTGEPEEDTSALADGAANVSDAVQTLLGLGFDDFCTCVVLPQGDFADFLHAAPNKRQEKLERILALGVYDLIMRRANAEAAAAAQRAQWLDEQLGRVADATDEAEQQATARVSVLEALAHRVEDTVPTLSAAADEMDRAEAAAERLRAERALLAALTSPGDLADLDARHRDAVRTLDAARATAGHAEQADTTARDRRAAAPHRGPLEQVLREHAELGGIDADLPTLAAARTEARAAYEAATRDAETARSAVDDARTARETAAEALAAATDTVRRLTAERDALRAVVRPGGLDRLDRRRSEALATRDAALARVAQAEATESRAREAAGAAPARGPLEQARRDHRELAGAREELRAATGRQATAARAAADARTRAADARRHLDEAREHHDRAQRTDLAAVLRPALIAGGTCPVCAQPVASLPGELPAADLDDAREAVTVADRAHEQARQAQVSTAGALEAATAETARVTGTVTRWESALAEAPGEDGVDEALRELDRLAQAVEDARDAARAARRESDAADSELDALRHETARAATLLRSARDPLVALGAPDADPDDVVAGWRGLVGWAGRASRTREAALPGARESVTAAARDDAATAQALARADRTAAAQRGRETAAARAEQAAAGALAHAERRAGELRGTLDGAVTAGAARAELDRVDALERAVRAADVALREARSALRAAERDASGTAREVDTSWARLRAARDPLVALGAPATVGDDLPAAWDALTAWAGREAGHRDRDLVAARGVVDDACRAREALVRRLADDLAAHDVVVPSGIGTDAERLPRAAPVAVAAALGDARGARQRVAERRRSVVELGADRDRAETGRQVAKLLGDQLRSNNFPRWLVASALDALVTDASGTLADLSAGQFELTHDRGEFLVIDHADADSPRPVKTLSGGETFQASLALALALSAQLSGLAAEGAARLESIFLDEGFGTLDEANLDVVASTLESLAMHGDRTVGVITHVPALAERVPVRFVVSRDQRGATIVREGP